MINTPIHVMQPFSLDSKQLMQNEEEIEYHKAGRSVRKTSSFFSIKSFPNMKPNDDLWFYIDPIVYTE